MSGAPPSGRTAAITAAVSKPMTARFPVRLPFECIVVADESALTWSWGRRLRPPFGDAVTQAVVVWKLARQRRRVQVLIAGRYADLLALIQAVIPFGRRPLLLLDSEWMLTPRSPLRETIIRQVRRLTARGSARMQVFCEAEAEHYSRHFGIPIGKFVWIPYCPPDVELAVNVSDGGYIFSGGMHERDWATFAEAVRDLPVEVRIAAPPEHIPVQLRSPNMVFLGRIPREEYFRQLAGCRLLVLSVAPVVRFPGVITYAYAMRLGKCVVINEPLGAPSYIEDGVTGRIVPNRDAAALHTAIAELLANERLRNRLADEARRFAERELTPAAYWDRVARVARDVVAAGPR